MCATVIFMSKCHIFYFLYDRMAFNLILSLNFRIHPIAMILQMKECSLCYSLYKETISKQSKKIFSFLCLYFVFDFAERYWTIVIVVYPYIILIYIRANPSISIRNISILCMHMSIKIPYWMLSI